MKTQALDWLLEPKDPPVRLHTLRDILHYPAHSDEVTSAQAATSAYRPVRKMLNAQTSEGIWLPERTCYSPKWTAAVWPLILLGEMGVHAEPWIRKACERFLSLHQMSNGAFAWRSRKDRGKKRMEEEPCLTGNMIRTLLVFGYGEDPRIRKAIDWMPEHQLEDGGWNCDYPYFRKVTHSSFMSTIEPLWAYSEIPRSKWTRKMKRAIERGAEFILMHHLYKSDHHEWRPLQLWGTPTDFHFPMYYYYDALHGLRVLTKLGYGDDERISDAVHLALSKKTPEGKWLLEGDWVRERKNNTRKTIVNVEHLMNPSKWITLNCYRALTRTGDLEVPDKVA